MIAVQELDPELAFELGDPLRDRRLGRVQPVGGATEAAELDHPEKGFERPEVRH